MADLYLQERIRLTDENSCLRAEINQLRRTVDSLRAERDEAREVAVSLHRFLSYHEAAPEVDEQYGWLIEAVEKTRETCQ